MRTAPRNRESGEDQTTRQCYTQKGPAGGRYAELPRVERRQPILRSRLGDGIFGRLIINVGIRCRTKDAMYTLHPPPYPVGGDLGTVVHEDLTPRPVRRRGPIILRLLEINRRRRRRRTPPRVYTIRSYCVAALYSRHRRRRI